MSAGSGSLSGLGSAASPQVLRERARVIVGRGETMLDGAGWGSQA